MSVWRFYVAGNNKTYLDLNPKLPNFFFFFFDFKKYLFSRNILINVLISKLHENPSSRSRVDICGKTDIRDRIGAFRENVIAPKIEF